MYKRQVRGSDTSVSLKGLETTSVDAGKAAFVDTNDYHGGGGTCTVHSLWRAAGGTWKAMRNRVSLHNGVSLQEMRQGTSLVNAVKLIDFRQGNLNPKVKTLADLAAAARKGGYMDDIVVQVRKRNSITGEVEAHATNIRNGAAYNYIDVRSWRVDYFWTRRKVAFSYDAADGWRLAPDAEPIIRKAVKPIKEFEHLSSVVGESNGWKMIGSRKRGAIRIYKFKSEKASFRVEYDQDTQAFTLDGRIGESREVPATVRGPEDYDEMDNFVRYINSRFGD